MKNWQDYLLVPYQKKGSSLSGCDCWHYVALVDSRYAVDTDPQTPDGLKEIADKFAVVVVPSVGDLVMLGRQECTHVGIVVERDRFLQMTKHGPMVGRIKGNNTVIGFARPKYANT